MKLPKYIKLKPVKTDDGTIKYDVLIAWWGVPIFAYKEIKQYELLNLFTFFLAWFYVFPKVVIKEWLRKCQLSVHTPINP